MTRRELREQVFLMLFRVEFHGAEEVDEQIALYKEQLEECSEKDCDYILEKFKNIVEKLEEMPLTPNGKINRVLLKEKYVV